MLEILTELENTFPIPADVREENKLHPRDFYLREIRVLNGHFYALAEYLYEPNPRVESPDDLIRALEHPIPFNKLTEAEKAAWKFHFGDFGAYFELNYERMLLAEAWLRAEAAHQHGGDRQEDGSVPPWLRFECNLFDD
jgi:hypothetical protein